MPVLPPVSGPFPGLNPSALDIIKQAMRLIGVLATGEEPSGPEGDDALQILNQMIDDWDPERLMVYAIDIFEFPLIAGQQDYTVGTNGDFDMARPARIDGIGLVSLSNPAQPLELEMTSLNDDEWGDIPVKDITSTYPLSFYNDNSMPYMTLSFYPIPSVVSKVRIYSWHPNQKFTDLTMLIVVPPGYIKTMIYCLAVDLAPQFGVPTPPEVAIQAVNGRAKIKSINTPAYKLSIGPEYPGRGGHYDWRADVIK